jgi:hypothetical protein
MFRPMFLIVCSAVAALSACSCASVPEGQGGEPARALEQKILTAVHASSWADTKAVRFSFRGDTQWLWDLERGMVRQQVDDHTVWIDLWDRGGVVAGVGAKVDMPDEEAAPIIQKAYERFINDSFWFYPYASWSNDGVVKERVEMEGREALLVRYSSGGVTPGDTYVYAVDDTGMPTGYRMWVQILPVKGVWASHENHVTTKSGIVVAQKHGMGPMTLDITDVGAATSLAELMGSDADPFVPLVNRRTP